jgi:hypothetical protein
MRAIMAPERKKRTDKPKPTGGKHTSPREAFHLPTDLKTALEAFVEASDPPTTKTGVMIAALKEYLGRRGAWPPAAG